MKNFAIASICTIATVLLLVFGVARADTDAGPVRVPAFEPGAVTGAPYRPLVAETQNAGSGSAVITTTTTTTTLPSDALHNPVDDPLAAINDARTAKKNGWAFAIFAVAVMLTAGLAKAAVKWPTLPVLATINAHKTVLIVIAAIGVGATAAYNALADGGSWYSVLLLVGGAVLTFVSHKPSEPAPAQNAQKA